MGFVFLFLKQCKHKTMRYILLNNFHLIEQIIFPNLVSSYILYLSLTFVIFLIGWLFVICVCLLDLISVSFWCLDHLFEICCSFIIIMWFIFMNSFHFVVLSRIFSSLSGFRRYLIPHLLETSRSVMFFLFYKLHLD